MVDWLRSDIARRARDAGMSIVVTGYAGLDVEADTGQEHDASRLRIGAPRGDGLVMPQRPSGSRPDLGFP